MGFLYQVLKDVSEKQPYSVGKTMLKDFVERELKPKLSTGRKGFEVIAQVAGKVGEYNEKVKQSNDDIQSVVTKMQNHVGNELKNKLNAINENNLTHDPLLSDAVEKAQALAKEYGQKGEDFNSGFNNMTRDEFSRRSKVELKEQFKDLNSDLRSKINNARDNVSHEANRLTTLSATQHRNLQETIELIKQTCSSLKKCVKDKIRDDVTALVKEVEKKVAEILKVLKEIEKKLWEYVKELQKWINDADIDVGKAMKDMKGIIDKGVAWPKDDELKGKVEELKKMGLDVYAKFESSTREVENNVNNAKEQKVKQLDTWKAAGDAAVKQAKEKCTEIGGMVETKDEGDKIHGLAKDVKDKANKLREAAKDIKDNIQQWVQGATGAFDKLEDHIKTKLGEVKTAINLGIEGYLKSLIDAANGRDSSNLFNKAPKNSKLRNWFGAYRSHGYSLDEIATGFKCLKQQPSDSTTGLKALTSDIQASVEKLVEQVVRSSGQLRNSPSKINLHDTIDGFNEKKQELNHAITEINSKVNQNLTDHNKLDEIITTDTTFKQPFDQITAQLNKIAGLVDSDKPTPGSGDAKTGITNYLDDLKKMLKQDPLDLQSDIKRDHTDVKGLVTIKNEIDTALDEIGKKAKSNFDAACTSTGNAVNFDTLHKTIKNKLTEVLEAFAKKGREVETALKQFKVDKIGRKEHGSTAKAAAGTLQKIHDDIANVLRDQLEPVIGQTTDLLKFAQNEKYKSISTMCDFVDKEVKDATNKLITQANKHYVTSVKDMLQAFADKVQKELKPLPGDIDTDRQHGFKGFMRTLEGTIRENETSDENIERLKGLVDQLSRNVNHKEAFTKLSQKFKEFWSPLHDYLKTEIKRVHEANNEKTNPKPTGEEKLYTSKLEAAHKALNTLLDYIHTHNRYNHEVPEIIDSLSNKVDGLHPKTFNDPSTPLLDGVGKGLDEFAGELGKAYINMYEGSRVIDWDENASNDSVNCAKITLTIIDLLDRDLGRLHGDCSVNASSPMKILSSNGLGKWFQSCGFKVSADESKQTGELDGTKGIPQIRAVLIGGDKHLYDTNKDKPATLLYHLYNYRRVCHLKYIPKPQPPTTICAMLHWLSGLYWNPMYSKIERHIPQWYGALTADYNLPDGNLSVALPSRATKSMKGTINRTFVGQLLNTVTNRPCQILIRILGHGHASGRYACDFYTNVDNLDYPSSAGACFDMFIEIIMRLNYQLRFLYKQCTNYMEQSGWRDCWYGRGVGGSRWRCNEKQCPNQECTQKGNQIGGQTADQRCDQITKCGLKSPLQSFLEDGLPGFLPHQLTKIGCGVKCSIPNHSGTPCITPMGFRDLSITASHTKKGDDIRDILEKFCGPVTEPLSMLCAFVTCLTRRPPQDLGDMFSFYHNFLEHWSDKVEAHKKQAFDAAVTKANLGRAYPLLDPAKLQVSSMHASSSGTQTHLSGDLFSLLSCNPDSTPPPPCGQYLQPMSLDARCAFSSYHASLYLSWVVYLTETFYLLLKKLRDEFCRQCNAPSSKCHGSKCVKTCEVKYTEGGAADTQIANQCHKEECSSITNCFDAHATMYSCGFTFGSPYKLSGTGNSIGHKRTCKDFCKALEKVVGKGSLIVDLIESIDEFLWAIRTPFSYLVVALWSASFLYLLNVYIGRLDALHIRSHLRTPASHRIAAQSLLAAARVGRLSKIAYLQP